MDRTFEERALWASLSLELLAKAALSRASPRKSFNDDEAIRIAEGRNSYLYSATATIAPMPAEAWWPRYWALAHVLFEGDEVLSIQERGEQVSESDYDIWMELEVGADYFSCATCRCVLDTNELLDVSGVRATFEAIGDTADFWEPDYGND